jgi:hypothetical protein
MINYRLNLEKKYLEDLAGINKNLYECCAPNSINGVQKTFMEYVGLTDTLKPYREQYLDKLKHQLNEMIKFRVTSNHYLYNNSFNKKKKKIDRTTKSV